MRCRFAVLVSAGMILSISVCFAQENSSSISRKVVARTAAEYPKLARSMHLGGTVRLEAVVAPNGTVRNVAIRGGSPVLATAAADAVRKWKWVPTARETTEPVEIKFQPWK
jgi:TonB family protein